MVRQSSTNNRWRTLAESRTLYQSRALSRSICARYRTQPPATTLNYTSPEPLSLACSRSRRHCVPGLPWTLLHRSRTVVTIIATSRLSQIWTRVVSSGRKSLTPPPQKLSNSNKLLTKQQSQTIPQKWWTNRRGQGPFRTNKNNCWQ